MSKKVEPSDEQNEESHSRLMLAVKEYFKANQDWHVKKTRRAGENSRYWLSQIRMIARERREHIQQYREWLDLDKNNQKAQNHKANTDDNAN